MYCQGDIKKWLLLLYLIVFCPIQSKILAFPLGCSLGFRQSRTSCYLCHAFSAQSVEATVKVKDLLSDLPTPTLLMELSLAESALNKSKISCLDDFLRDTEKLMSRAHVLDGSLFVHTKVTDTSERDKINQESGSGKSVGIGLVDCPPDLIPGGAYLGIGLANHHVGGYYWARGMGMGASLPAHGVEFRGVPYSNNIGELYWKKRGPGTNAAETTEESSNSNDGKRSEWADFLVKDDTVQLVPYNTTSLLLNSPFQRLIGVRRLGRPLGSDPIVERIWKRDGMLRGWVIEK